MLCHVITIDRHTFLSGGIQIQDKFRLYLGSTVVKAGVGIEINHS